MEIKILKLNYSTSQTRTLVVDVGWTFKSEEEFAPLKNRVVSYV